LGLDDGFERFAALVDRCGLSRGLLAELGENGGVLRIGGQVVAFAGVGFEVEQHLEFGRAVLEVHVGFPEAHHTVIHADVFPTARADAFLERVVAHCEQAFEKQLVAPRTSSRPSTSGAKAAAVHELQRLNAGVVQYGGGVVEAGDEVVELAAAQLLRQRGDRGRCRGSSRSGRSSSAFAAHAVFAHQQSVVAAEEDDGVLGEAATLKVSSSPPMTWSSPVMV
jgi:hypothetical protein